MPKGRLKIYNSIDREYIKNSKLPGKILASNFGVSVSVIGHIRSPNERKRK